MWSSMGLSLCRVWNMADDKGVVRVRHRPLLHVLVLAPMHARLRLTPDLFVSCSCVLIFVSLPSFWEHLFSAFLYIAAFAVPFHFHCSPTIRDTRVIIQHCLSA